jgi:threonine dehydratase
LQTVTSDPRSVRLPTDDDFAAATTVVARELDVTPVMNSPLLGDGVMLKLEMLQPTGSFKVRGGLAALAAAATDGVSVVAASAGNHGLGVAYAAARFGVEATVVVPENASVKKVHALEQFDITLVHQGDGYDEAESHALALADADPKLRFVSPYNDPHTIAGQATIAGELVDQVPELSTVIVPVGGGGLISGVSLGLAAVGRGDVRVVGVVAAASIAFLRAYELGRMEPVTIETTLADGLAGNLEPSTITLDIAREHVDTMVSVTEAAIEDGIRYLAFEHGIVSEGSGAVGVAALQTGQVQVSGKTVLLVTGRNIAPATLASTLDPSNLGSKTPL